MEAKARDWDFRIQRKSSGDCGLGYWDLKTKVQGLGPEFGLQGPGLRVQDASPDPRA